MLKSFAATAFALGLMSTPALATGLEIDVSGVANGTIAIDLLEDVAPGHAERSPRWQRQGAYDGVVFHRVIDGFMAQTGDVEFGKLGGDMRRAGMGGSDMPDLAAEFSDVPLTGASWAWRGAEPRQRQQPVLHHVRPRATS
jgi:peptidylprolyl isomerase